MKKIAFIAMVTFFISCRQTPDEKTVRIVRADNHELHFVRGDLYFNDDKFTGHRLAYYPEGWLQSDELYGEGKQSGRTITYYRNGEKESERYYTEGDKDSVHTGWWPGGKKKFEYHFWRGLYNGPFVEWYSSGAMTQRIIYSLGKEVSGQGWRENGSLFMNFIWRNGRRYGLVNPNMCYGISGNKVVE